MYLCAADMVLSHSQPQHMLSHQSDYVAIRCACAPACRVQVVPGRPRPLIKVSDFTLGTGDEPLASVRVVSPPLQRSALPLFHFVPL
jgi:hypothetical protein